MVFVLLLCYCAGTQKESGVDQREEANNKMDPPPRKKKKKKKENKFASKGIVVE